MELKANFTKVQQDCVTCECPENSYKLHSHLAKLFPNMNPYFISL